MDTKSKAEKILSEIAQSDNSDPLDVAGVCQAYLTHCQEVERLNTLLDEFWDMRTLPYESFKPELLNRLRAFSKEDKQ